MNPRIRDGLASVAVLVTSYVGLFYVRSLSLDDDWPGWVRVAVALAVGIGVAAGVLCSARLGSYAIWGRR